MKKKPIKFIYISIKLREQISIFIFSFNLNIFSMQNEMKCTMCEEE